MRCVTLDAGVARVVGRDRELAAIDAFLAREPPGPGALVITGEAGIGKTELWRHALCLAERQSTVLACRPVEAESLLPFAGLVDLFGGVADALLPSLAEPQRRALAAALLRVDPVEVPLQQLAVSLGVLSAVRELAASSALVIAVDDVQWLDPSTAQVLEFACRRLRDEPVQVVVTMRSGATQHMDVSAIRSEELTVEALPVEALGALLRGRLDLSLPRSVLIDLHAASAGNPLYALEIARHALGEMHDTSRVFALPPALSALLGNRIGSLSPRAGELVVATALLAQPSADVLKRAGFDPALYGEASVADVLELEGDRIRFTHPLLAAEARSMASPDELLGLHHRLASAVIDEVERAGHLAQATTGPDETVARLLEHAAETAGARGASHIAARLAEHALRLTATGGDIERRTVLTAEYETFTGDRAAAVSRLEALIDRLPAGPQRSDALRRLAHISDPRLARDLAERALAEAEDDAAKVPILTLLVTLNLFAGEPEQAPRYAELAMRLADSVDMTTRGKALAGFARVEGMLAGRFHRAILEEAAELHRLHPPRDCDEDARFWYAGLLLQRAELAAARALFAEVDELAAHRGDVVARAAVDAMLARLEAFAGNWSRGRTCADRAAATAADADSLIVLELARVARGLLLAMTGKLAAARVDAEAVRDAAAEWDDLLFTRDAHAILGFIALAEGDPAGAKELLSPAVEDMDRNPDTILAMFSHWNLIEALVTTGDVVEAERRCDELDAREQRFERPAMVAPNARCRALVLLAQGDGEQALERLDACLVTPEAHTLPFEQARTLLLRGRVLLGLRRKRDSDAALIEAQQLFERLGALPWVERAAAERARLGLRHGSGDELTPMELRVADALAAGATTQEAAAVLFVSPKTVEFHLSNVYRKLGIRSRAELARRIGHDEEPVARESL
jgi:DNA-binding CsgD family transcriptional regulator